MKIIALKLITNEELLGEEIGSFPMNPLTITLKNPVGIAVVRGKDGTPNIGFSPFPLHAEQKSDSQITIQRSHIVYSYQPAEDFIINYDQVFGSGIVLPKQKIIV